MTVLRYVFGGKDDLVWEFAMSKPNIEMETERLFIRPITDADKKAYMEIRANNSQIRAAYGTLPGFSDYEWENELNSDEDLFFVVYEKGTKCLVGSASFQKYKEEVIEIGIDIAEEFRRKGLATEIIKEMLTTAHRIFPEASIQMKTNRDNMACIRLIETCGGIFLQNEDSLLSKALQGVNGLDEKCGFQKAIDIGKGSVVVYKMP